MLKKIFFFFGLTLSIVIAINLYRGEYVLDVFQQISFMTNSVEEEEEEEDDAICRTKWYRKFHLEFGVFSVENFSKVIFLMDYSYTYPIKDGMFKCLFYEYGTNQTLEEQFLNRIGGKYIYDPHRHTFSLQCSIPKKAIDQYATKISFLLVSQKNANIKINISICRSYQSTNDLLSKDIHLVQSNETIPLNGIGACTQTAHHDSEFPLWINYHYRMGIDHFYIYDHAPSTETTLHKTLQYYLKKNLITIIPWHIDRWSRFKHHPTNWITHQIWSQNDCIRRYGHLHSWLLISDVDEYVVPMDSFDNFIQILNSVPSNYCALQILHFSFGGLQNETSILLKDRPKIYVHRHHENQPIDIRSKNFVRPNLINYFSVHCVTQSVDDAPVFYGDVDKHVRLHHYQRYFITQQDLKHYRIDNRLIYLFNRLFTSNENSRH